MVIKYLNVLTENTQIKELFTTQHIRLFTDDLKIIIPHFN